ncbi:uncharacterized protein G2W53_040118 [Senna tora]|uniref:Uncharacterized protein n=1 Tax=Senna tora TaxID=362788 RepID=A0A834SQJ0_9FABA|nr:uncharacterized protein G2W53_040118 [Senna tora]
MLTSSIAINFEALFIISVYEVAKQLENSSAKSSKDDTLHRFSSPNCSCASSFRVEGNARHMTSSVAPAYSIAALSFSTCFLFCPLAGWLTASFSPYCSLMSLSCSLPLTSFYELILLDLLTIILSSMLLNLCGIGSIEVDTPRWAPIGQVVVMDVGDGCNWWVLYKAGVSQVVDEPENSVSSKVVRNPHWVGVYIGVPEEAKVAVMDVLGAPSHWVYSLLGGAQCNRVVYNVTV